VPLRHLLLLGAMLLAPVARATPVALYPVQGEGVTDQERADTAALLDMAVRALQADGAALEPRSPFILEPRCAYITAPCIARLAEGGLVLLAKLKRDDTTGLTVSVMLVDAVGRATRRFAFASDVSAPDLRPASRAIALAQADLSGGEPASAASTASAPSSPSPSPEPAAAATPEAVSTAPFASSTPAPERVPESALSPDEPLGARPSTPWTRSAGLWTAAGGAGLLLAGTVVGLLGRNLNDDLTERYQSSKLTNADRTLYDRLDTYEWAANALLIGGGVALATGTTFLVISLDLGPRNGGLLRVEGRF